MTKLKKSDIINILQEELQVTTLADTEGLNIRVTKPLSAEILDAVVNTYKRILTQEQAEASFGDLATFKAVIKPEQDFSIPNSDEIVTKPERLTGKVTLKPKFKKELEETEIN